MADVDTGVMGGPAFSGRWTCMQALQTVTGFWMGWRALLNSGTRSLAPAEMTVGNDRSPLVNTEVIGCVIAATGAWDSGGVFMLVVGSECICTFARRELEESSSGADAWEACWVGHLAWHYCRLQCIDVAQHLGQAITHEACIVGLLSARINFE